MSQDLWTWSGAYFGYREDSRLWTYTGLHVGNFYDDDVYGSDGRYMGTIEGDRLITKIAEKRKRKTSFIPLSKRFPRTKGRNYVGMIARTGYEDFPLPETFG